MQYTLLDGYTVVRASEMAICIRKNDVDTWIPRSAVEDGDTLDKGDTDIAVANWLVTKEGLE